MKLFNELTFQLIASHRLLAEKLLNDGKYEESESCYSTLIDSLNEEQVRQSGTIFLLVGFHSLVAARCNALRNGRAVDLCGRHPRR